MVKGAMDSLGEFHVQQCASKDCARLRILLTGCAGFIGARVASLLLDGGHEVAAIDALRSSSAARPREWRLGNLTDRAGFLVTGP